METCKKIAAALLVVSGIAVAWKVYKAIEKHQYEMLKKYTEEGQTTEAKTLITSQELKSLGSWKRN